MGCTSPLVDRGGVMVCESMSHLVDGCSPDIVTPGALYGGSRYIYIYKYKNEVGCRDDTVAKIVDTRRHCEEE